MSIPFTPPSIVVGVDGSRAGVRAALWAIAEAVSRDIPLRLVCAIEPGAADAQDAARHRASADLAVHYAANAIEATERPVKVETDIVAGRPLTALVEASRAAAMICVGPVGLKHFDHDRMGSTVTALAASAHCPVAIVRERAAATGAVIVEVDESPDSAAVLQFAVQEARLRGAPLRVLGDRMVHTHLDRRLSQWQRQYPDLDARPATVHGSVLTYLAADREEPQLGVVGAGNAAAIAELLGPAGSAALRDADCSVLVVDRQRLL